MERSILVPLDGKSQSETVLPYALALARHQHLGLRLVHIVEAQVQRALGWSRVLPALRQEDHVAWGQRYLEALQQRLATAEVPIEVEVAEGDPAEVILAREQRQGVALLALTTRAHRGLRRWAFGGILEQVLHRMVVPALLIRGGTHPPGLLWPRRLLLPLDGSDLDDAVLRVSQELATASTASIVLMAIVPRLRDLVTSPREVVTARLEEELDIEHDQLQTYLDAQVERLNQAGIFARGRIAYGYPTEGILDTCALEDADMLMLTTGRESVLGGMGLSSLAMQLVEEARLPLMLVRTTA